MDAQVRALTAINERDLLRLTGFDRLPGGGGPLRLLLRPAARRFARRVARYDTEVARRGLGSGARWALRHYVAGLEVAGIEHVPPAGPLLVVANHPGLSDTIALFAALAAACRLDTGLDGVGALRIVAAERPFLAALPATARYLIALDEANNHRLGVVRRAAAHLRTGGALLTFPAGRLEPDPALEPAAAAAALAGWSPGFGLCLRLVPDTVVVPAIVTGVFARAAFDHPLARLHRDPERRSGVAAALQIALPPFRQNTVRVAFGPPLHLSDAQANPAAVSQRAPTARAGSPADDAPVEPVADKPGSGQGRRATTGRRDGLVPVLDACLDLILHPPAARPLPLRP